MNPGITAAANKFALQWRNDSTRKYVEAGPLGELVFTLPKIRRKKHGGGQWRYMTGKQGGYWR